MIADDLMQRLPWPAAEYLRQQLHRAVIVKAQNVADYYFEGTDQETWSPEDDFPNCAPPWPVTWMEWRHPRFSRSAEHGLVSQEDTAGRGFGVLVVALRPERFAAELGLPRSEGPLRVEGRTIRWLLQFIEFTDLLPDALIGEFKLFIDEQGRPYRRPLPDGRYLDPCVLNGAAATPERQRVLAEMGQGTVRNIPLLAFCFCHCRNVQAVETALPPALVRRRAQRGRAPVSRVYTLDIQPFRRAARQAAGDAEPGLARALHICRGHFKDFRGAQGLFSKHHGMYWWDMHLRGSPEAGAVDKAYAVHAPTSAAGG